MIIGHQLTVALYLAHLNPLTKSHLEIINELKNRSDHVQVMPVIFLKNDIEVNSRSFPFNFEIRKEMLESVLGDTITISKNYTFTAPYSKYLPPVLSPYSWKLRKQILKGVKGDYFTYTGDKAEGFMLKIYHMKPMVGIRKKVSSTSVKNKLYDAVKGLDSNWKEDVPDEVVKVIEKHWDVIEKLANIEDKTKRVIGMKFPIDGFSK